MGLSTGSMSALSELNHESLIESDIGQLTDTDPIWGPKLNPKSCQHSNVGLESTDPKEAAESPDVGQIICVTT